MGRISCWLGTWYVRDIVLLLQGRCVSAAVGLPVKQQHLGREGLAWPAVII